MPNPIFAVGDVVQLNSGGPLMTVAKVSADKIAVAWFENGDNLTLSPLPIAMLTKVDNDASSDV